MEHSEEAPTQPVADLTLKERFGWRWRLALLTAGACVLLLVYALADVIIRGIGIWGNNWPFVWGFDLTNYAWWIGIANGASLFAAILVLRRHNLRTAINRFSESLALFAVICAVIFPVIHLGRPWLAFWMFPYPATYAVWPQFRSPLTWDFWAILTHLIVTTLFWYIGLIPDLARLRDDARPLRVKKLYGFLALGWRGSVLQWACHQRAHRLVATSIIPLLFVLQTTAALEFSTTLVPGWHETRQPLHFVATGFASGLGVVFLLAHALRRAFDLEVHIDEVDIDLLGRLVLATAMVAGYLYMGELLLGWLGDAVSTASLLVRLTGDYAYLFWGALLLTVGVPQLLWWPALRQSARVGVLVAISLAAGVWLDRLSIVVAGVQRGNLLVTSGTYAPTLGEYLLLTGSLGLFAALVLLFVRFVPVISMYETQFDQHRERR